MGAVLALGVVAGTALFHVTQASAQRTAATREAHQRALTSAERVRDGLAEAAAQVAKRAGLGASLPGLSALVGTSVGVDDTSAREQLARTFKDAFENEAWWAPYRALGMTAFFVGRQPLYVKGPADLAATLEPLVKEAETAGSASRVLVLHDAVWLVGAAVVPQATPQQLRGVLVLLQPMSAEALVVPGGGAAGLVAGATEPVVAGDAAAQALLVAYLASGRPDTAACCAQVEVLPGVHALAALDATDFVALKLAESQRGRWPVYVGSVFLVAGALFFGFRPRREAGEQHELLRQTTAELQASRAEMQRLSQRLSGSGLEGATSAPGRDTSGAGVADDGLGATTASVVQSRYHVITPLGEGGMARVSVAEVKGAEGFRRMFVLKRLRPELAGTEELVNQFIDEARLGASLVHSNIVPVFDFGRDAEGYYLAQEYILGRDVDYLVQASMDRRQRALEPPLVLYLAQEALKALAYAHTKTDDNGNAFGLVHRDVSPNNLMVSARGEVKLLDFGIVKSTQRLTRTQTGVVKGNLFYMAPEQARGLPVDPRADLFSLGMVLFYAATGLTLYQGASTYELMARAGPGLTDVDRMKVSALGPPLAPLLLRALATDPADRYPDADDFARAVAEAGAAATSADLQRLVDELLSDELAAEQGRLTRGS